MLLICIGVNTPYMQQSKTLFSIKERGSINARNSVFDCHSSPIWRQMTIENYVSNDFWSTFVGSNNVFDWRLSGVSRSFSKRGFSFPVLPDFWFLTPATIFVCTSSEGSTTICSSLTRSHMRLVAQSNYIHVYAPIKKTKYFKCKHGMCYMYCISVFFLYFRSCAIRGCTANSLCCFSWRCHGNTDAKAPRL